MFCPAPKYPLVACTDNNLAQQLRSTLLTEGGSRSEQATRATVYMERPQTVTADSLQRVQIDGRYTRVRTHTHTPGSVTFH